MADPFDDEDLRARVRHNMDRLNIPAGMDDPTRRALQAMGLIGERRHEACRHCGDPIHSDTGGESWTHDHHLYRCQKPGRPYGYEARPPTGMACDCWACEKFGQTAVSPEKS